MHKDELRIQEPCNVDWNAMKRGDKSRFCGECKKTVHDLSRLDAREAEALLSAPASEGLCVRYLHDALGHVVFADTFRDRPIPAFALLRKTAKAAAAAAMLVLPLSLTACMGARAMPPPPATPEPAVPRASGDAVPSEAPVGDAGVGNK